MSAPTSNDQSRMPVKHDISDLTFRPMSREPSDLALLKKCFDENGSKKRLDALRWRYFDNPTNTLLVDYAVSSASDEPHLAATYAVSPVRLKIGDQTKLAAQSIDTMTDHRHRGKGLFSSLAKSVYSRCEAEEVAAVFGFPNGSSAHGFFKRLEWTALDPVPFLIRPLGTRGVLSRLSAPLKALPNLQLVGSRPMPRRHRQSIRPLSRFGPSHDALWNAFASEIPIAVERGHDYLNWRFVDNPLGDYAIHEFHENESLQGYVVFRVANKHGGRIGYVMELIYETDRPEVGKHLLRYALEEMAADGAELALAWCFGHSPNRPAYRGSGFLPFPERFRPIELHFGARRLAYSGPVSITNRRDWYISYADSDTV